MRGRIWIVTSVAVWLAISGERSTAAQQQPAPDFVLTNGKIITVDDRFTIAEAVAVLGERIIAVGTNQEIAGLVGPNTTLIDLEGRSVIPGLIDNHAHIMEEGPIWQLELRLDGIETRAEALNWCANARWPWGRANGFSRSEGGRSTNSPTIEAISTAKSWTGLHRTIPCCCRSRANTPI